ncbi:NAD(FAD)-dependent dehydrogenase [Caldisphaera lagunensis DSM 15908]|uniref:NAD(FAD)-dependent dehydrogenase n=1 Tax=Caldisphaera lagunensis (strain DSM 15908 / JCM 11604 / ANMR 0165 / IC-154) TaxID=1056495 RepID=L0AAC8_CALLD|nr:FAD-dependent oxidoreductase [Caldisphaera lagunensis]AFZ70379.1 NAD(FAD)-dependent dehydrogenase [Caldisphaera lagunensis DSM 15908]
MNKETLAIIGGGDAGMTTASWARRRKPHMNIIVFEKTNLISHAPCGLPYFIEGLFDDEKLLSAYTPEEFEKERNVNIRINHEIIELDLDNRVIYAKNRNNNDIIKLEYDYLAIATGSKPKKIKYDNESRIFYVHHPSLAREVKEKIMNLNNVAIIGGGILGVELAEALVRNGKNVLLIHKNAYLLNKMLDNDMASYINNYVSKDIKLKLNEEVLEITDGGRVIITNNGKYEVDGTIVSIGVEPNTELINDKNMIGETKAIKTDEYMRTSYKDVYAVGDVAESTNIITGMPDWQPFAPVAGKMGFTAGNHIGGVNYRFPGLIGTAITKYGEYFIAKTGLTENEAKKYGFKTISTIIRSNTRARYYPGGKEIIIKLIADENTQKLIGAQIIGQEEVLGRIDLLALAIMKSNTLYDLFYLEHAYMPAISRSWDPVILAARSLLTKF